MRAGTVQQTSFVGGVLVDPLSTPQQLIFTAPLSVVPAALAAVSYRPASLDFWDYDYLTVSDCFVSIDLAECLGFHKPLVLNLDALVVQFAVDR